MADLQADIAYAFRASLGDQNQNDPLWKMPEKGVFTEDFYRDLVQGTTDLVVHSWKDLPTEEKAETWIAATLPRADQRDVMLFKKESFSKPGIRIYSSSPRRSHNLQEFLPQALPWKVKSVEFRPVRGNISTRVQKLLADDEIDGLIVAKAALDRLLSDQRFTETRDDLREAMSKLEWMVLPLSENPNAAAQGALAIEVNRSNQAVMGWLEKINDTNSYLCAQREREILKEFGGGCHLALGMSVLQRSYGRIEIVRGLAPNGERIHSKKFYPTYSRAKHLSATRLEFQSERQALDANASGAEALFVSRADAWIPSAAGKIVWAAGLQTWKKLASLGVWVHGSAEALGDKEDPRINDLVGHLPRWVNLTHEDAPDMPGDRTKLASYKLNLKLLSKTLPQAEAFEWKSASEFSLALKKFPELKIKKHLCGPGRTFDLIKRTLGTDENIYVELKDEFITAF